MDKNWETAQSKGLAKKKKIAKLQCMDANNKGAFKKKLPLGKASAYHLLLSTHDWSYALEKLK